MLKERARIRARPSVLLCDEASTGLAQALLPPILGFLKRWAPVANRVLTLERSRIVRTSEAREFDATLAQRPGRASE